MTAQSTATIGETTTPSRATQARRAGRLDAGLRRCCSRRGASCSASPTTPSRCSCGCGSARSPGTSRRRGATTCASCATGRIPMVGLVIYFYSRGLTDELGLPVHYTMPIRRRRVARAAGRCRPSGSRRALRRPVRPRASHPRWYDVAAHHRLRSHFLTGLTIAAVLWVREREAWLRWMRRYVAINFGALVVYIVYPMAPPWMASEQGFIDAAAAPADRPRLGRPRPRPLRPGPPGRRQPGRGDAVPARRHRRSWSRCTASGGCARRCGSCWLLYPLAMWLRARLLRRALRRRPARRLAPRRRGDGRVRAVGAAPGGRSPRISGDSLASAPRSRCRSAKVGTDPGTPPRLSAPRTSPRG